MPTKVKPEAVAAVAGLIAQGKAAVRIARETQIPHRTVRDIIADLGPQLDELKQLHRDAMLATWQDVYYDSWSDMRSRRRAGDLKPSERQSLTLSMAIATDKLALLSGQPTQIVANVHEVRISMPDLISKLAAVGRSIAAGSYPSQGGGATCKDDSALEASALGAPPPVVLEASATEPYPVSTRNPWRV